MRTSSHSPNEGARTRLRELVRRYERPVFSLIFRMVRDSAVAEDLAQDTFVKVLNHIDKYRPEFKLSSWPSRSQTTSRSITSAAGRSTRCR